MGLGEKFEVVSVLDPAIDTARMPAKEMLAYVNKRDMSTVRPYFKGGALPTIFHMREIPHDLWESYVAGAINDDDAYRRAFLAGLECIENLYQRDGVVLPRYDAPREPGRDVAANEVCQRVSPSERAEIGRVVYMHSFLHPRIERTFLLPPTVHEQLVERAFLPAVANPSSPASSSDAASSAASPASAPTDQPLASTDASCAAPTAATAPVTPTASAVA